MTLQLNYTSHCCGAMLLAGFQVIPKGVESLQRGTSKAELDYMEGVARNLFKGQLYAYLNKLQRDYGLHDLLINNGWSLVSEDVYNPNSRGRISMYLKDINNVAAVTPPLYNGAYYKFH